MSELWTPVSLWLLFVLALVGFVGWIVPVFVVLGIVLADLRNT